jgi:hypothetical protein
MAVVRYAFPDEFFRLVAQHEANARGDVEKCTFETEDNNEVGGFFEEQHVQKLVAIVGVGLVRSD